jgi:hypothetical protein
MLASVGSLILTKSKQAPPLHGGVPWTLEGKSALRLSSLISCTWRLKSRLYRQNPLIKGLKPLICLKSAWDFVCVAANSIRQGLVQDVRSDEFSAAKVLPEEAINTSSINATAKLSLKKQKFLTRLKNLYS